MTDKIEQKITGYAVKKEQQPTEIPKEVMQESVERPAFLRGATYKIKEPTSEHALYITINDILLNCDTEHEEWHPYEIFINSKNVDHFQWVVALTRTISAVFRKGGDITFLVKELKDIFDPKGGYFIKGKGFCPSLIAHIGMIIEEHLIWLGKLEK